MTTREIRERAAELIEERGWHQGGWKGPDGALCLDAALWMAAGVDPWPLKNQWPPLARMADMEMAAEFGWSTHANRSLAYWNDAPGRTKAEVLAALRKEGQG